MAVETDRLDALFVARPEDFIAVRTQLVQQLKAEDRKDDAREVAALRKPSATVWAVMPLR